MADHGSPDGRFRSGAYGARHAHLTVQLRTARPDSDAESAAHAILACVAADLFHHLRNDAGYSLKRITESMLAIVDGLLTT